MPFLVHFLAAAVSTLLGGTLALALGLAGQIAFFAPVVVASGLIGWFVSSRRSAAGAAWVWVPAAVWFAGWVFASMPLGFDHFMRVFVGAGYCGDFSCAGQLFATGPLVGSIAYAAAARATASAKEPRPPQAVGGG